MKSQCGSGSLEGRRGSALALALVAVAVVAGLGLSFLTLAASVTKRQVADVETVQAFYLAEAGLAEAFHAVRAGRSGMIGTIEEPATFGGGLLWVEAVENREGQIELDAQALFGRARSALRMTVEPVPLDLGFFADEDLVIDSVLLVDGFDSGAPEGAGAGAPEPEGMTVGVPPIPRPDGFDMEDAAEMRAYYERFFSRWGFPRVLSADAGVTFSEDPAGPRYTLFEWEDEGGSQDTKMLTSAAQSLLGGDLDYLRYAYPDDYLSSFFEGKCYFIDEGAPQRGHAVGTPLVAHLRAGGEGESGAGSSTAAEGPDLGLLGSNGDVQFLLDSEESVTIVGDVVPGAGGAVLGLGHTVSISGSTEARGGEVELPAVDVPALPLEPAVHHSSLLPLTVPPGALGLEALTVAADAETVLRGPLTMVVGQLELEPGALLTLDTRNGPVDLYVTEHLWLAPGSDLTTTAERASDTTIRVAAEQAAGDPLVQLEATSSFTGTVYSPTADVRIGAEFEVFGSVVARRLELAPGVRLHAERASDDRRPLPELVSWKMLVVPMAPRFASVDPFALYGLDRADVTPLATAHDLDIVELELAFLDGAGVAQEYRGIESGFDWSRVEVVTEVERRVDYELAEQNAQAAREAMDADVRKEEPISLEGADDSYLQEESRDVPGVRNGVELACSTPESQDKWEILEQIAVYRPISDVECDWVIDLNIGLPPGQVMALKNP